MKRISKISIVLNALLLTSAVACSKAEFGQNGNKDRGGEDDSTPIIDPKTTPGETPPGTGPNGTGIDTGTNTVPPGNLDISTGSISALKVGINFEDMKINPDNDYNDAVMCFNGNFMIRDTTIYSAQDQVVTATTSSKSICNHRVDAVIKHADGTTEIVSFESNTTQPVNLNFKAKSEMTVSITTTQGDVCIATAAHSDKTRAQVQPNLCNLTGD